MVVTGTHGDSVTHLSVTPLISVSWGGGGQAGTKSSSLLLTQDSYNWTWQPQTRGSVSVTLLGSRCPWAFRHGHHQGELRMSVGQWRPRLSVVWASLESWLYLGNGKTFILFQLGGSFWGPTSWFHISTALCLHAL